MLEIVFLRFWRVDRLTDLLHSFVMVSGANTTPPISHYGTSHEITREGPLCVSTHNEYPLSIQCGVNMIRNTCYLWAV